MSNSIFPDLETAKGMAFSEIAKAINGFIADSKKNNALVSRQEIESLQSLVEVLSSKAPVLTPHPGPRPVEPQPPRPPRYPYDLSLGWPDYKITLSPEQETYSQNYPKYCSEYEARKKAWRTNTLSPWEEAANKYNQVLNSTEHRIIKGIRKEIDRLFLSGGRWSTTRMVNWEILPPGDGPVDEESVANLFAGKSSNAFIPERLIAAVKLSPVEIVSGRSEFNDYLCFRFSNNNKVLLESPYEGNAAYVLRGDWETLSKKTKWELLNIYSDFCERIIHGLSGNWKHEIKRSLGLYS